MILIRAGGYLDVDGVKIGHGLFYHYKAMQQLLWPEDEDHHRWSDWILKEILDNRITVLAGARDTGKTHVGLARYGLTDYFVFPNNTLTLISSTDSRGLQLRVFGDIKDLLARAKERYPWLPGHAVESLLGIFTDELGPKATIRDMRKGIICVPCVGGDGENLEGLEKFIGIKQARRRLLGDEVQFMDASYLNTLSNLDKGDFKGVFCGNFLGRGDPLDQLAEPKTGWASMGEPRKTTAWDNLKGGRTLNLVGIDSPNFDYPQDQPSRYPYLIDRHDVDRVKMRYGEDSLQFWSQIRGVRKSDLMAHRVLTVDLCRKFGAFGGCLWDSTDLVHIYSMDAAFGGDRPVHGHITFGREVGGRWVIKCHKPETVKLKISDQATVEEQLALAMKSYCELYSIPPQNCYYDAGMRATLAVTIGRVFSTQANAINFGGAATDRPVSADDYIYDEKDKRRRLKKCSEAYSKFVTELNYSVRMVVEAGQMREIPESVVREFEMREWTKVSGDRIELETKAETKKRMGNSPDEADWLAIGVEGARRRGFQIEGIKEPSAQTDQESQEWLAKELSKFKTFTKRYELKYGTQ
jgi:hypothetical protein